MTIGTYLCLLSPCRPINSLNVLSDTPEWTYRGVRAGVPDGGKAEMNDTGTISVFHVLFRVKLFFYFREQFGIPRYFCGDQRQRFGCEVHSLEGSGAVCLCGHRP